MEKRGFLVRVDGPCGEVLIDDEKSELSQIYNLLNCDLIDITRRTIAGETYDIVCDDEGALKEGRLISAVNGHRDVMFFGNLLIMRHRGPELTSLTDEDVVRIRSAVVNFGIMGGIGGLSQNILLCDY